MSAFLEGKDHWWDPLWILMCLCILPGCLPFIVIIPWLGNHGIMGVANLVLTIIISLIWCLALPFMGWLWEVTRRP